MPVEDCPECQKLMDEWKTATVSLRGMRRSAMVWDYGGQKQLVDQKLSAYKEHRAIAHAAEDGSPVALPAQMTRQPFRLPVVSRRAWRNLVVGLAVVTVVLLALFLPTV